MSNNEKKVTMKRSKFTPYRLPAAIIVFFMSFALLTRTALFYIPTSTSSLISDFYPNLDTLNEVRQVALIYAIVLSIFAHFFMGKLMKVDSFENRKGLIKSLGIVALITIAYSYSLIHG